MKDNLLPFNLEEAKKDPSRIRFKDGEEAIDVHFFSNGVVAVLWKDGNHNTYQLFLVIKTNP
jgi:hypothetical protein